MRQMVTRAAQIISLKDGLDDPLAFLIGVYRWHVDIQSPGRHRHLNGVNSNHAGAQTGRVLGTPGDCPLVILQIRQRRRRSA